MLFRRVIAWAEPQQHHVVPTVALVAYACAELFEDALQFTGSLSVAAGHDITAEVLGIVMAVFTSLKALSLLILGLALLRIEAYRKAIGHRIARVGQAVWVHRLATLAILVIVALSCIPAADLLDQLPDVQRQWADEGGLGQTLISHPDVDRVILTGSYETAALFRSWRPELPLLAETSGKNAMIVMPSADLDLAAGDLVKSAFGHAGQKCSAASLAILVGPVGHSQRFARQLIDAVNSLRVGPPTDPLSEVGPVVEPPQGKLAWALTTLEARQHSSDHRAVEP